MIKEEFRRFFVCCDECGQRVSDIEFLTEEMAENWVKEIPIESEMSCPDCDGTGEVEHDCDCDKCDCDYEDCQECDGSGTVEIKANGPRYYHLTQSGKIYCHKCTAMLETKWALCSHR